MLLLVMIKMLAKNHYYYYIGFLLCFYPIVFTNCIVLITPRCIAPYVRVQDNWCYYVEQEFLHTSFDNFCYQERRTSRICLDSDEEMRALADHLYTLGFRDGTKFWSAGNRWAGDLQFYWNHYGRARPINYTNWEVDEPTAGMGLNCMLLTLNSGELIMTSESCRSLAFDICEMDMNPH